MRSLLVLALAASLTLAQEPEAKNRGHLLVVGGGGTPDAVLDRGLMLAGGAAAKVVILPQASKLKDAGLSSVSLWRERGASDVTVLSDLASKDASELLNSAALIWMPGGSQGQLYEALKKADLVEVVKRRYREGAVIGGTSAGAAVQSNPMIARDGDAKTVGKGRVELEPGLGLLAGFVVDQHFHARGRFPRLLTAVLSDRTQIGIGIDEKTALIVDATGFSVLGEGTVLVIDARQATPLGPVADAEGSWKGVVMHHLRSQDRYDNATGPRTR